MFVSLLLKSISLCFNGLGRTISKQDVPHSPDFASNHVNGLDSDPGRVIAELFSRPCQVKRLARNVARLV